MAPEEISWPGGAVLRVLRTGSSRTQYEVARAVGVHHTYVARVERSTRRPSLPVLKRWVATVGCPKIALETHVQALWHLETDPWSRFWAWAPLWAGGEDGGLAEAADRLDLADPTALEALEGQEVRDATWRSLAWLGAVVIATRSPVFLRDVPKDPDAFWGMVSAFERLDDYDSASSSIDQTNIDLMAQVWPYLRPEDQQVLVQLARRLATTNG